MKNKKIIIGGDHSLDLSINSLKKNSAYEILQESNSHNIFFRSGRDAFYSILNLINPKNIWLPNYICSSLWEVSRNKYNINWYGVNNDLGINTKQIIENCKSNDVLIIIATLGSKSLTDLEYISKTINSTIIIDLTHVVLDKNLINNVKRFSNYQIFSLRKAFPVLDGGLLSSSLPMKIKADDVVCCDSFLSYRSFGLLTRGTSMRLGINDLENIKYLRKAEEILDKEKIFGTKISSLSMNILNFIDYKKCSLRNRKNKLLIYKLIKDPKSFKLLPQDGCISLYIPMIFSKKSTRDFFRKKLKEYSIYFPVHWPMPMPLISQIKTNKSSNLSDKLLSIPCDYRYSKLDLEYMCLTLKMIDKSMT